MQKIMLVFLIHQYRCFMNTVCQYARMATAENMLSLKKKTILYFPKIIKTTKTKIQTSKFRYMNIFKFIQI